MSIPTASLLPPVPARRHDEEDLQRDVHTFLRWNLAPGCYHYMIPNGGKRSRKVSARMNGQGLRAGVPDLCVIHKGLAHFIELKIDGTYLSAVQRQEHSKIDQAGGRVAVCRSVPEVQAVLHGWGVPLRGELTG